MRSSPQPQRTKVQYGVPVHWPTILSRSVRGVLGEHRVHYSVLSSGRESSSRGSELASDRSLCVAGANLRRVEGPMLLPRALQRMESPLESDN